MKNKILIIDDDSDFVEAISLILSANGYEPIKALSGEEGFNKAKHESPDLILLDIMLPDMSGWDLFQKIRNSDSNVKIAFLSAIPVSDERKKTLKKSGVMDYIMKPFDKADLISRVKKIVK